MDEFSPRTIRASIASGQLARSRKRTGARRASIEKTPETKNDSVQTCEDPQTLRNARMIGELQASIQSSQEELRRLRRIDGVPSSKLAVVAPVDLEFCRKLTEAELSQVYA